MTAPEIASLFRLIAAALRRLAAERLQDGDPEVALRLAEEAARAERQAAAAGEVAHGRPS